MSAAARANAAAPAWDRATLLASPWLGALRGVLRALPAERFPTRAELSALAAARGVTSGGGAPIAFVAPEAGRSRALDAQYEVRIYRTGEVPTRELSWHDLFNALVWLAFPRTKAMLNRRHDRALREAPHAHRAGARGIGRDVLTLFDEGGMLVACADAKLAALLRAFRWKELFWVRRAEVAAGMRFHLFGHAICERSLAPFRGVAAKALVFAATPDDLAMPAEAQVALADAYAAGYFGRPESLASTRLLAPLPVLGIPGWVAANADPAYYDDVTQFRPGRRAPGP